MTIQKVQNDTRGVWQEAVAEAIKSFKHGDTIDREWLEVAFGIDVPDVAAREDFERAKLKFFAFMMLFREELLTQHKMALKSLGRGQWQIVPPGEQAEYALEQYAGDIERAGRRAEEIFENTRLDMLTADESRARNEAVGKLAAVRALTARVLDVRRVSGPTGQAVLPLEKASGE